MNVKIKAGFWLAFFFGVHELDATTDRVVQLRSGPLNQFDVGFLQKIEQHGWGIIHVAADEHGLGFSYTVGLFLTTGFPEVLQVGLPIETANYALNELGRRAQAGKPEPFHQRVDGLLNEADCQLYPLLPEWKSLLMRFAVWFNPSADFPAVQCVFPDLKNNFPWETNFDPAWRQRQALLFEGQPETCVERDLRYFNSAASKPWQFPVARHTGVYTTRRIMNHEEPVAYVSHDTDGDWQFHGASESKPEDAVLVHLHHITDHDDAIYELADLDLGYCAWRDEPGAPWHRAPVDEYDGK